MALDVYRKFELFFEGIPNYVEPIVDISTYTMGITKLKFDLNNNILHVYLRQPGLLIGKGGETINRAEKYLDCNIQIHEVKNLWN